VLDVEPQHIIGDGVGIEPGIHRLDVRLVLVVPAALRKSAAKVAGHYGEPGVEKLGLGMLLLGALCPCGACESRAACAALGAGKCTRSHLVVADGEELGQRGGAGEGRVLGHDLQGRRRGGCGWLWVRVWWGVRVGWGGVGWGGGD
jgi:hypothetical protein